MRSLQKPSAKEGAGALAYEHYVSQFKSVSIDLRAEGWRLVAKEALSELDSLYFACRDAVEIRDVAVRTAKQWQRVGTEALDYRDSLEVITAERDQLLVWREKVINAYPDAEDIR